MIPKILHFIWLGDSDIPDYGKFAIDVFSKVNPTFQINVVHDDPANPTTSDFKDFLVVLKDKRTFYHKLVYKRLWAVDNLTTPKGKNCNLADAFRVYLVNKYGGIYLDLDTFPVKPFDNFIMSKKNFSTKYLPNQYDNFFFGCEKGKIFDDFLYFSTKNHDHAVKHTDLTILYPYAVIRHCEYKSNIPKLFYDCKLQYRQRLIDEKFLPYYYIDHFQKHEWHKNGDIFHKDVHLHQD